MPLAEPVRTTDDDLGRVPRVDIETFRDRAVSPALQRQMYAAVPCRVLTIVTGHMPMLSHPRWLADRLVTLADGHEERVAQAELWRPCHAFVSQMWRTCHGGPQNARTLVK